MDDLGINHGSEASQATASLFSGHEEIFAFDRTLSRMSEMQTEGKFKSIQ
jgi:predicted ATPase